MNPRRLTPQTTLENLKKEAKRRLKALRSNDPTALTLRNVQLALAREHGFAGWIELKNTLAAYTPPPSETLAIDTRKNQIGPRRLLSLQEWDALLGEMQEQHLTSLNANGFITDEALGRISKLSHVTSLDLSGSRELSDEGLQHLAKMPQLQRLSLNEYPGGKLTDRGLEVLCHLPELQQFEMTWQSGITDAGAANLQFCEKLERVNLMGSPTGDSTIEALRGKPRLRYFQTGRFVTDAGLAMLHDFPRFKSWHPAPDEDEPTRLLIDGPFTNEGLASLAGLDGVYALDLFWHVTGITTDAFEVFSRLPNLGSLGCDGGLSDDRAMHHIAAIPRLRKLRAQGSVATDEGFIALSRSLALENFWGREAPNLTGKGFAALSKMPSLKKLGISCLNVDDHALSTLPDFPALRDLTPIDVRDEGFRHIARCAKLERLACMYCRDTTDLATEHIRNLRLKTYYAGKTQITNKSLEILSGMPSLQQMQFWQCAGITDAGLLFLATLPNLREIQFSGTPNVTLKGTRVFPTSVHVDYST